MKRITVSVTFAGDYQYAGNLREVRTAMVNAAVLKATEHDMEIAALGAKTGHVKKVPA